MKRSAYVLAFMMLFSLSTMVFAESFKVYPGAKLEDIYETKQSGIDRKMSRSTKVIIFTTNDFFENVVAFYRGIGREYRIPGTEKGSMKLSSGRELKEAYFILDNAA